MKRREFTALGLSAVALPAFAQDASFDKLTETFLEALWREDPDAAVAAGRFEFASRVTLPSNAQRERLRTFHQQWLARFQQQSEGPLSTSQRMDRALLIGKLQSDLWRLDTLREWSWNPSEHNPAAPLDLLLNTDYAPLTARLTALKPRIAALPAYYRAARTSLAGVTREHTELAIQQAPGVLGVLDDIAKRAAETGQAVDLAKASLAQARAAVNGYVALSQAAASPRRGGLSASAPSCTRPSSATTSSPPAPPARHVRVGAGAPRRGAGQHAHAGRGAVADGHRQRRATCRPLRADRPRHRQAQRAARRARAIS